MSGHAVVSCHVERPLDDRVWDAFESLLGDGPAGSSSRRSCGRHTPLRERTTSCGSSARVACSALAPLGHHTHWGGPSQARPQGEVDAAAVVRRGGCVASRARPRAAASSAAAGGTSTRRSRRDTRVVRATSTAPRRRFRQQYLRRGRRRGCSCPDRAGCGSRAAHRCSSCPRPTRWACSRAGSSAARGSSTCTSTTGSSWTESEPLALEGLLRAARVRRRPLRDRRSSPSGLPTAPELAWEAATIGP